MKTHLIATTFLAGGLFFVTPALAQQDSQSQQQQPQATGQQSQGQQSQGQQQQQAQGQGAQIHIGPSGIQQIQKKLNEQGFDVGNVDGSWNQETKDALKNFQKAQNLPETENLTIEALAAMELTSLLEGQGGQQKKQGGQQQAGQQQGSQTQAEGAALHVGPAGVFQIKKALNQQGFDAGNPDGKWNEDAKKAAKNFLDAQGMKGEGNLTPELITALGADQILSGKSDRSAQSAQIEGEGAPLHVGQDSIRQIQQALAKEGFDPGGASGQWDQKTKDALKQFQQAQGLEATGSLTLATTSSLGMGGLQQLAQAGGQGSSAQQAGGQQGGQQMQQEPEVGMGGQSGQSGQSSRSGQQGQGGQQSGTQDRQRTQDQDNVTTYEVEPRVVTPD